MNPRRQMLLTGLGAIDLMLVLCSLAGALALTGGMPLTGLLERSLSLGEFLLLALYLLYWHVALASAGLYGSYRLASASRELRDVVFAAALASAPVPLLGSLLGYQRIGAALAVTLWALSVMAVASGRRLLRAVGGLVRRSGRNLRDVVVAGEGAAAHRAADDLVARGDLGYRIVEVIDAAGSGDTAAARAQAALVRLEARLDRQPIDEVFLAFPLDRSQPVIAKMVSLCEEQGVLVRLIADLSALPGAWAAADSLVGRAVMTIGSGPDDVTLLAAKRVIDLGGAVAGLMALAPALLAIAIAIKLDSRGPVIFAQERIGLNRRRFRAFKFRTMVPDAERLQAALEDRNEADGPVFKIKADPRITRLGRWLRATSLDELPQLLNVLRGEMSLVGPRPLPVRDVERIDVRWHKRRFSVKPGITCLWQIRSRTPEFDAWIRSDMEYIDNWSLALDFKILAKTLPAVLSRQNAY
ncbi:MAG TPA: exopolysaccharide biosynthesis polyprenyl glycosylphosphotransferase [Candidatus Dormibacteraeota bacterium]|nr:exopolysaccharide biosynthesis polyprenyl glycosylphosphotransferase [Candidatus Dormibacteraeota bacterium]